MPDARRTRVKEWAIALVLALVGAGLLWLSLAGLVPFVHGVGVGAPLVSFSAMDARALPAALAAFSLAIMFLAPSAGSTAPAGRRGGAGVDPRTMRWVGFWLALSVVFALAALLAGSVAQLAAAAVMERSDYRLCPAPQVWEHHPPFRWVRAGGRCP